MKDFLTSKFTLGFIAFGAGLTLILGLFSRAPFVSILLRILVGGLVMGAIGVAIQVVAKRFLPEKELNELIGKKSSSDAPETLSPPPTAKRVDITDDSEMSPHEVMDTEEYTPITPPPRRETGFHMSVGEEVDDDDVPSRPSPPDNDSDTSFQETSFDDAPRISKEEDEEIDTSHYGTVSPDNYTDQETSDGEEDVVARELDRLKEKAKETPPPREIASSSSDDGDASFTIGKKKISADPKIIARAIRTVINRE